MEMEEWGDQDSNINNYSNVPVDDNHGDSSYNDQRQYDDVDNNSFNDNNNNNYNQQNNYHAKSYNVQNKQNVNNQNDTYYHSNNRNNSYQTGRGRGYVAKNKNHRNNNYDRPQYNDHYGSYQRNQYRSNREYKTNQRGRGNYANYPRNKRGNDRERGRGNYNNRQNRNNYNNSHQNRHGYHQRNQHKEYKEYKPRYQPKSQSYSQFKSNANNNNNDNQLQTQNIDNNHIEKHDPINTNESNDNTSTKRPISRFGVKKKKKKREIADTIDFNEENSDNPEEEEYDTNTRNNANTQTNGNQTIHVPDYDTSGYHAVGRGDNSKYSTFSSFKQNPVKHQQHHQQNQNQHQHQHQHQQNQRTMLETENLSERAKKMVIAIKSGKYDCMVCQSLIGKKGRVWTCNHCHTTFHITCINKWARAREEKDAESEQRAIVLDEQITTLRCPACNFVDDKFRYNEYKCFCGKVIFDHDYRSSYSYGTSIPHSCGDICGRKRGKKCPHLCSNECHPGPCSKCTLPSKRESKCYCGKLKYSLLCGDDDSNNLKRKCNQICNKLLICKNHRCTLKCHDKECNQCDIKIERECFCGRNKKLIACGDKLLHKIKLKNKQVDYKYSCATTCNKPLSCGNHYCGMLCHSGSCSGCPRRIETPTKCACGKSSILSFRRNTCLDPLPVCSSKCNRMLLCGKHFCNKKCHDSKCNQCTIQMKQKCRCGATDKRYKCHDYVKKLKTYVKNNPHAQILGEQNEWVKCHKTCKRVMSCGIHECRVTCCKGKSIRNTYYEPHHCTKICNKPLSCKRHKCTSFCHTGKCNPCGVTYRNGVRCACGNVYVEGPFQCGTKSIPQCTAICDNALNCGHLCAAKCHHGSCPQCHRLCSKPCYSHDILVHNLPCHVINRSCGNLCAKILKCGYHRCTKACHNGLCEEKTNELILSNKKLSGCGQSCRLELKCGHPCLQKCHGLGHGDGTINSCSPEYCKVQITVQCKCGNTSDTMSCRGRTKFDLKAVPCTENCEIAQRNKRFREALKIDNTSSSSNKKNKNKSNSDQKDNKFQRIPFAAATLKRILKYMNNDKNSTIIKNDKEILSPKFVYYMEGVLKSYLNDNTTDAKYFKQQHSDITVLINKLSSSSSSSTFIINLKPMNSEQRFIVYSMVTSYHIKATKLENGGKKSSSFIELMKSSHSIIPDYLLSKALLDYQLFSHSELYTLESMPPESIIVIDNADSFSSSIIQDKLLPYTGDYRMWRNDLNQLFIVFTDEKSRNSALVECGGSTKFGGRKATKNDSFNCSNALKKNQQKKFKNKLKQKQSKLNNNNNSNSNKQNGWNTIGNANAITANNMPKKKKDKFGINMANRFG